MLTYLLSLETLINDGDMPSFDELVTIILKLCDALAFAHDKGRVHHKLEECYEEVIEGHMPLRSYLLTHKDARLSDAQRERLAGWFKEQMVRYE